MFKRNYIITAAIVSTVAVALIVSIFWSSNASPKNATANNGKENTATSSESLIPLATTNTEPNTSRVSDDLPTQPVISNFPLADTEVEMVEGAKAVKLTGSDGLFDQVLVSEDKPVTLKLNLPKLQVGHDVIITAPNGGSLYRVNNKPLRFKATAATMQVELIFQATGSPGSYCVVIQHMGASQALDFWQGPQHPRGLPGPTYSTSNKFNSGNR